MPLKKVGKKFQPLSYDGDDYGQPVGKPLSRAAAEKKVAVLKKQAKKKK